jgi:small subunit ribosomal protein S9
MVEKKPAKKVVAHKPADKAAEKPAAEKAVKVPKPHAPRKVAAKKTDEAVLVEVKGEKIVAPVVSIGSNTPSEGYFKAKGRRKEATARVRLIPGGKGTITINGRPLEQYFQIEWDRQNILAPLVATGRTTDYDITVRVEGGGIQGQSIAVRHGIARALLIINEDYRKTLRRAGYLTRDPRAKERKKPGLKRARKRGQWAKR